MLVFPHHYYFPPVLLSPEHVLFLIYRIRYSGRQCQHARASRFTAPLLADGLMPISLLPYSVMLLHFKWPCLFHASSKGGEIALILPLIIILSRDIRLGIIGRVTQHRDIIYWLQPQKSLQAF